MRWRRQAPEICGDLSATIGNTPLLRLARASERAGATILGKAEFMNPGGSGTDRAALYIVRDAERRGLLRPGGLVVSGASGPMGGSLALVAQARGYRVRLVAPAEAAKLAERLAASEPNGVLLANPWDDRANRQSHYETTGPELWRQSGGRLDAFVCSVETGGTLAGVGAYLRERSRRVRIVVAEPLGAAARVTGNLAGAHRDGSCSVSPEELDAARRELLHGEGLALGPVSALHVAAALRIGRELGPGHAVATLLCDAEPQSARIHAL